MNDANVHYLTKDDIEVLRSHMLRHNLPWNGARCNLLNQGSNGRLSDAAYRKYKKLLMRIEYEMRRRRSRKTIVIPKVIPGLSPKYYKFR